MTTLPLLLLDWATGEHTGRSSMAIARRAAGLNPGKDAAWSTPGDPDDFERCYKLLKMCPFVKIECMKGYNRIWDDFVDAWPEMEMLWQSGKRTELFQLIQSFHLKYTKGGCRNAKDILY